MAKKKRLGLIYDFDENWIGGSYYIQNLIKAFKYLPKSDQVTFYILTKNKSTFIELEKDTDYPHLKYYRQQFNIFERFVNKVSNKFCKKEIYRRNRLDWVFPLNHVPKRLKDLKELIFWIPDFQEKYLPDFFSKQEIENRQLSNENIVNLNHPIVFSSYSALNDFKTFYPYSKNKTYVIQFAVVHPNLSVENIDTVKAKYNIEGDYFISPNQFWQHKNQIAIIEAIKILRDKGIETKIIFTGKEFDYRNPNYTLNLKAKVVDYKLEKEILFLGFIDRVDQLLLMKNAQAVIQPSLFEGWSSVVEDSKALNQTLIVSDIPVHREQLVDKSYFFEPNDFNDLALKMNDIIKNPIGKIKYNLDYTNNLKNFALNLKSLTTIIKS